MVDAGRLGRSSLHRVAPLSDIEKVLTDRSASADALREMRDAGIDVESV